VTCKPTPLYLTAGVWRYGLSELRILSILASWWSIEVPELLFESKRLIPALQQLLIT